MDIGKFAEESSILLTNKQGCWLLASPIPSSRFEGVFFTDASGRVFKTIEHLEIDGSKVVEELENNLWAARRKWFVGDKKGHITEQFCIPEENALIYSIDGPAELKLVLDCKEIFDNREWGREYKLSKEQECLVISFLKKNDIRDDNSIFNNEFRLFIACHSPGLEFMPVERWLERNYSFDRERSSPPYSRFVFFAARLRTKEPRDIIFAFSRNRDEAIKTAKRVFRQRKALLSKKEQAVATVIGERSIGNERLDLAYACSKAALDSLIFVPRKGSPYLRAGLPWFFERWTRDELVSSKALMLVDKLRLVKEILFYHLRKLDGWRLTSKDGSQLVAADAPGWLFLRIGEFFKVLEKEQLLTAFITKDELAIVKAKLHAAIERLALLTENPHGLIWNSSKESWMDTEWNDGGRAGYRVEIQAGALAILALHRQLFGAPHSLEQRLLASVRKKLWDGKQLADGIDANGMIDWTARPNVFIAAYLYPQLLSKKEWILCFENILPRLWLDWGGLATIDKRSVLFLSEHTGEDVRSYHRGDSWFWLNNLVAIVLARGDKKRFQAYINKILDASATEILTMGAIGHHAELSSASKLSSKGCLSQAWSSALFIELINELYGLEGVGL